MEAKPKQARVEQDLVADYRPRAGTNDEMMGPDGRVREPWRPLLDHLNRLPRPERDAHFARADRYLHDAGVFYRAYGDGGGNARQWPLAHVPLLIEEAEWRTIADGLAERAELLEAIVADIYGDNRLVGEGLLPPQLIAASPEYLRPMLAAAAALPAFPRLRARARTRWPLVGARRPHPGAVGGRLRAGESRRNRQGPGRSPRRHERASACRFFPRSPRAPVRARRAGRQRSRGADARTSQ
jgi:hypothetical protein